MSSSSRRACACICSIDLFSGSASDSTRDLGISQQQAAFAASLSAVSFAVGKLGFGHVAIAVLFVEATLAANRIGAIAVPVNFRLTPPELAFLVEDCQAAVLVTEPVLAAVGFLLAITAIGLGIGYVTHLVGLSFAFGAFVAGLVLSESDYGHQALSDIVPLRDLFGLLFFASVGMLLDLGFLMDHLGEVALLVAVVSVAKGLIFVGLTRAFGYRNVVPIAMGLGLFQIGEFSFVLARVGLSTGSIDHDLYSLVLTTAIMTMALTPLISGQTSRVYAAVRKRAPVRQFETKNVPSTGLRDHVVLAGGGRVGLQIAQVLHRLGFAIVVVELDHRRVEQAQEAGMPVIFGDASHEIVLEAACIGAARLLVVSTPEMVVTRSIVVHARARNPGIEVVARTSDPHFMEVFKELDVRDVVLPEFETGLEMTRQALVHLEMPQAAILSEMEAVRHAVFAELRASE